MDISQLTPKKFVIAMRYRGFRLMDPVAAEQLRLRAVTAGFGSAASTVQTSATAPPRHTFGAWSRHGIRVLYLGGTANYIERERHAGASLAGWQSYGRLDLAMTYTWQLAISLCFMSAWRQFCGPAHRLRILPVGVELETPVRDTCVICWLGARSCRLVSVLGGREFASGSAWFRDILTPANAAEEFLRLRDTVRTGTDTFLRMFASRDAPTPAVARDELARPSHRG